MNTLFRFLSCTTIAVLTGFSTPCVEADIMGFQGFYAPANWTAAPGTGSIDTSLAPASIALTSGDNVMSVGVPSNTDFSIVITTAGTVSFDWRYVSSNTNATYDPFFYFVNSTFTPLSVDAGPLTQSGSVSFGVLVNDVFGFRQRTIDNTNGSATTTITLFSAPGDLIVAVPEPATASLLGFAILIGASWQLVKRRRPATTA